MADDMSSNVGYVSDYSHRGSLTRASRAPKLLVVVIVVSL